MNILKRVMLIGIAVVFVAGLAACNKSGPAETAGNKIDEAAETASNKIEEATENAGEKIDEATTKIGGQD